MTIREERIRAAQAATERRIREREGAVVGVLVAAYIAFLVVIAADCMGDEKRENPSTEATPWTWQ